MRFWKLGAVALGLMAGCGGPEEDKIPLVPVSGKVTLDGKALEGVMITFVPNGANSHKTDGGEITGTGGVFEAKYRNRNGLAVGKYKVVIGRPGSSPGKVTMPEDIMKSAYMTNLAATSTGAKAPPPWPYDSVDRTPLTHEVAAKGDADLLFSLKSTLK